MKTWLIPWTQASSAPQCLLTWWSFYGTGILMRSLSQLSGNFTKGLSWALSESLILPHGARLQYLSITPSMWGLHCTRSFPFTDGLSWSLMLPSLILFPSALHAFKTNTMWETLTHYQVGLLVWCTVLPICGRKLGVDPQETLPKNFPQCYAQLTTDYSVPAVKKRRLLKILNGPHRTFMEIS